MMREITALGQHTLPFNDMKALMTEISIRFEANVYMGFIECYGFANNVLPTFKSLGLYNPVKDVYSCELYLLDEVHFSKKAKQFTLIYDDYQYKWIYEKYGEQAGHNKEFMKSWTKDPIENNKIIRSYYDELNTIDFHYENISGLLSLESADVGLDKYFTGWKNFFYLLTHTEYDFPIDFYKSLLNYRNTNKETILKLGGTCIYYHDNQGSNTGGASQGNEWDMTWEEIESSFNSPDVKKYQINLCDILTNPEYLKHIQELVKNNFHDYCVFYDDFRELTWDDIIKP